MRTKSFIYIKKSSVLVVEVGKSIRAPLEGPVTVTKGRKRRVLTTGRKTMSINLNRTAYVHGYNI